MEAVCRLSSKRHLTLPTQSVCLRLKKGRPLWTEPRCGVVVRGAGGIRKLRFGLAARGKRGGARVIYLFGGDDVPIFLLAVFAKNEKADLTATERAAFGKQVSKMLSDYRRQR